jgi:hypothetical protein
VILLVGLCLVVSVGGCVNGPGEFDGAGDVAGRIIYFACPAKTPTRCRPARIPKRATTDAAVIGVGKALSGERDGAGFGISGTQFGDGYVAAGHYQFRIPKLERPGCAPRPGFEIKQQMFYEIVFRFLAPGHCSATVWEQHYGNGPQPRTVISQVGG